MKVFVDTNVFVDYIEHRMQFEAVQRIMHAAEDGEISLFISNGSLYTLCYVVERALKSQGIHRPEQTLLIKKVLRGLLSLASLCAINANDAQKAIGDDNFKDMEDSFQYQCALSAGCDVLVTINDRDFKDADQSSMEIMTPAKFVQLYLN